MKIVYLARARSLSLPFYSSTESRNKRTLISKLNILTALVRVFPRHLLYSALARYSLSCEQYQRKPDPFYLETNEVCTQVLIQLSLWPKSNMLIFFCPLKLLNINRMGLYKALAFINAFTQTSFSEAAMQFQHNPRPTVSTSKHPTLFLHLYHLPCFL